jgi:small subunit ribosomal protein S20
MAHSKQARKRIRQNARDHLRNSHVTSRARTYINKALAALDTNDQEAIKADVQRAIVEIDKAVSKGVLQPNSGARKKSMLQRRLNATAQ